IDFTPALKAEAIKITDQYKRGPLYTPPIVRDTNGKIATLLLPAHVGGANWPGGAMDAETGVMYVASVTNHEGLAVSPADPARSDMGDVGGGGRGGGRGGRGGATGAAVIGACDDSDEPVRRVQRTKGGPQGLPLINPPWG